MSVEHFLLHLKQFLVLVGSLVMVRSFPLKFLHLQIVFIYVIFIRPRIFSTPIPNTNVFAFLTVIICTMISIWRPFLLFDKNEFILKISYLSLQIDHVLLLSNFSALFISQIDLILTITFSETFDLGLKLSYFLGHRCLLTCHGFQGFFLLKLNVFVALYI